MDLENQLRGDVSGMGSARLNERIADAAPAPDPVGEDGLRRPAQFTRAVSDPFAELKARIHALVVPRLGPQLFNDRLSAGLREEVGRSVAEELERDETPLSAADRNRLVREITADILGYGPLDAFLQDDTVTEIMVNGAHRIYVEREGKIELTDASFTDEAHLTRIIDRIVSQVGRRVDEGSPMVDARLPDGSRVNAIVPPLALDGPTLTVRKFSRDPYTVQNLIDFGTVTPESVEFLRACIEGKLNVLISGGTGTGKTTLLNALSAFVPADERIITIEDAAELQLQQPHVVRLESRPSNIEGEGRVAIRDLVINALRMRPHRIIVGEVRGGETLDMLQAMNTGHEGSLTTIHANSPRDALNRLETLVLMSGIDLPLHAIREQISSAFDLIVHLTRLVDGTRRVSHVTEVLRMESELITLQDLYVARPVDESRPAIEGYTLLRPLETTGLLPHFQHKLAANGVDLRRVTPGLAHERPQVVLNGKHSS
ncbi:MAG: CpaF family protein [Gaiella sp.]